MLPIKSVKFLLTLAVIVFPYCQIFSEGLPTSGAGSYVAIYGSSSSGSSSSSNSSYTSNQSSVRH